MKTYNVYFTNRADSENDDFVGPDVKLELLGEVCGPMAERRGGATPFRDQLVNLVGGWGVVDSCFKMTGPTYDGDRYLLYYKREETGTMNNEVVLIEKS